MDGCAVVTTASQKPDHGAARRWVESRKASNCEAENDPLRFTGRQGAAGSKIERSGGRPPDDHLHTTPFGWMGAQPSRQKPRKAETWCCAEGSGKSESLELRGGKRSAKVYEVAESESRKAQA